MGLTRSFIHADNTFNNTQKKKNSKKVIDPVQIKVWICYIKFRQSLDVFQIF